MSKLVQIIREQCLPYRNCMLTVQEESGQTAFLYFQDGELVEANAGADWGEAAVQLVFSWNVTGGQVGDLPLGIKRSLWEPIDNVLAAATASSSEYGSPEDFSPIVSGPVDAVWQRVMEIPGCLVAFERTDDEYLVAVGNAPLPEMDKNWIFTVVANATKFGNSLGAGFLGGWTFETDQYRIVAVSENGRDVVAVGDSSVMIDEFEDNLRSVLMSG